MRLYDMTYLYVGIYTKRDLKRDLSILAGGMCVCVCVRVCVCIGIGGCTPTNESCHKYE